MNYTNFDFKHTCYTRVKAFSLVEVMLAIIIIAIVIVLAAPSISKRAIGTNRQEGIVYTYNGNNISESNRCFINNSGSFATTNLCSEYEFTVPNGVDKVNLTLVAGGGGGGGASGGHLLETTNNSEVTTEDYEDEEIGEFDLSRLRSFKINHLVGRGEAGEIPSFDNNNNPIEFFQKHENYYIVKTGKGGKSSSAIHDFTLPERFYRVDINNVSETNTRTFRVKNPGGISRLNISNLNDNSDSEDNVFVSLTATYQNMGEAGIDCIIGDENKVSCIKDIPSNSFIRYQEGIDVSDTHKIDDGAYLPYIHGVNFSRVEGGNGGRLPYYGEYGAGGKGYSLFCNINTRTKKVTEQFEDNCNDASIEKTIFYYSDENGEVKSKKIKGRSCYKLQENSVFQTNLGNNSPLEKTLNKYPLYCYSPCESWQCTNFHFDAQKGTRGMYSLAYVTEDPGNPGDGGSAGTVLKIRNMPVVAGETYIIRVGKGGKGGIAGYYSKTIKTIINGTVIEKNYIKSTNAAHGEGGVSTSIWKKGSNNSETLIYLVPGGIGGRGGDNAGAGNIPHFITPTARYAPFVAATSDLKYIDTDIASVNSNTCSITTSSGTNFPSGANISCLDLPRLTLSNSNSNNFTPYQYLSYLPTENSNSIRRYGGFTRFENSDAQHVTRHTINNITYLSGFYFSNVSDNKIGYVGGLGGFTGFGGKAGCGGMFFGNINGFNGNAASPAYNVGGVKKMFIPSTISNGTERNYRAHNVLDYYDNCSLTNPDGHSAEFKLPNPKTGDVGQAGAGGGGGGYLMFKGAGNGGSGQDGYLMIDWRK